MTVEDLAEHMPRASAEAIGAFDVEALDGETALEKAVALVAAYDLTADTPRYVYAVTFAIDDVQRRREGRISAEEEILRRAES